MVDELKIGSVNSNSYRLTYDDFKNLNRDEDSDVSIFVSENVSGSDVDNNIMVLNDTLDQVQAEDGAVTKTWDAFKGMVGIGTSSKKCEDAIEQYKNGEISYEEALEKISDFDKKQESSLNLFSNIGSAVAAIVAASAVVATGGAAAPLVVGMLAGAATKAGIKTTDRATNEVDNDALDAKQIAKDALSGAVTGGIAVATAGTAGTPFKDGFQIGSKTLVKAGTGACVAKCATTGVITGAISGSSNNIIDCTFDEDKEFNFKDFAADTATSAIVGGTVGAFMGGYNGTLRATGLLSSGGSVTTANSTQDVIANSLCTTEYKLVNNTVRSVAA